MAMAKASAGKLGIQLCAPSPDSENCVSVFAVQDDSPLRGMLSLGDAIHAIDGTNIRGWTLGGCVTKTILARAAQPERIFSVLRLATASSRSEDDKQSQNSAATVGAEASPNQPVVLSTASTASTTASTPAPSDNNYSVHPFPTVVTATPGSVPPAAQLRNDMPTHQGAVFSRFAHVALPGFLYDNFPVKPKKLCRHFPAPPGKKSSPPLPGSSPDFFCGYHKHQIVSETFSSSHLSHPVLS